MASFVSRTVASTGANEKSMTNQNIPYEVSYTHSGSHASYYPGSETMAIKLIFSPSNGKILGAQIVGKGGVDKRIDVIATAIRGAMTVYDLEELELAYAPPYSSAKDPINEEELWKTKMHIRGRHLISGESTNTRMNRLAVQEFYFGRCLPDEEILTAIDSVDIGKLQDLADKVLPKALSQVAIAIVGPEAKDQFR